MIWLKLIHVLSAIIGIGPTYFGHILVRRNQSLQELRGSLKFGKFIDKFPKIGGSIAVLTGLLLIIIGNYGSFTQLWLIGSLVLYVLIQVVVIAFIVPLQKKLAGWVMNPDNAGAQDLPGEQRNLLVRTSNLHYVASALGVLLFIFMIMKP